MCRASMPGDSANGGPFQAVRARLAAHRAARDDLQTLLARWEQLFDQAQA